MSDYIPPELMRNILASLPVDDVLRCTSVCKSWYSLITSPSFASSHLNLSSPNQEPRLLVGYYRFENRRNSFYLHRDCPTFDIIADIDSPRRLTGCSWGIIDSLNGIVCLYDDYSRKIVLWNPSLRKLLILPKPRKPSWSNIYFTVGFGFVAASNEYKVVRITHSGETRQHEAQIYELSTGSWRDLKLEDYSNVTVYAQQAHLNGILHWHTCSVEKNDRTLAAMICTLDMKNEKCGALMVPRCLRRDRFADWELSTFRESLCLKDRPRDGFCNIWVMKEYGVADSWEKLFVIDTKQHVSMSRICCFRHNGEILIEKSPKTRGDKQGLVSYDCNNKQVKNLELPTTDPVFLVHTYVESLFLIKGPNDVKIDEESKEISKNL